MNTLIILSGLPGSGKTTFAKRFAAEVISSDGIRKKLFGDERILYRDDLIELLPQQQRELALHGTEEDKIEIWSQYVFSVVYRTVGTALQMGKSVVIDATNLTSGVRSGIIRQFEGLYDAADIYYFDLPVELVIERNRMRDRQVPESVIWQMYDNFEIPDYSEGADTIYETDGDHVNRIVCPPNGR